MATKEYTTQHTVSFGTDNSSSHTLEFYIRCRDQYPGVPLPQWAWILDEMGIGSETVVMGSITAKGYRKFVLDDSGYRMRDAYGQPLIEDVEWTADQLELLIEFADVLPDPNNTNWNMLLEVSASMTQIKTAAEDAGLSFKTFGNAFYTINTNETTWQTK